MGQQQNRIKEFRLKAGLSQTRLANKIGLASSNLTNLENGKLKPWPKVRRALARTLGAEEAELFPTEEGCNE